MLDGILRKFVEELNRIRAENGEDAYRSAAKTAAMMALGRGGPTEQFMREALKDAVDFDAVKREMDAKAGTFKQEAPSEPQKRVYAPAPPADEEMAKAIMGQMPGCQTQVQFNTMLAAFDALRLLLNAIFTGSGETEARKALEQSLEAARKATEISDKLRDVPEAVTSPQAAEFKEPPKQFHEHDVQRALLRELGDITTRAALTEWYSTNRTRIEQVVSPSLRNTLFDLIRSKKAGLTDAAPS